MVKGEKSENLVFIQKHIELKLFEYNKALYS